MSKETFDWRVFETHQLKFLVSKGGEKDHLYLMSAFNNYEVVKQLSRAPYSYTQDDYLQFKQNREKAPQDRHLWSIELGNDPSAGVIGHIGLYPKEKSIWTLFYNVRPDQWGKGYATEAANAVTEFAFDVLEATRVCACVYDDNPASLSVLKKTGFSTTGKGKSISLGRGGATPHPHIELELRAEDFQEHRMRAGCHSYRSIRHRQLPIVQVAAAALVNTKGELLVAQRPKGKNMAGLWEFPGGKIEAGETPEAALIRELREELTIETHHSCLTPVAFASHSYPKFHLMMPVFAIRQWQGTFVGKEGQAFQWIKPKQLWELSMPIANEPLIPLLIDLL